MDFPVQSDIRLTFFWKDMGCMNWQREKQVHTAVMDYMQKQNMLLREEVLALTSSHENDIQCLDWCIDRMEIQIKNKNLEIVALEPE